MPNLLALDWSRDGLAGLEAEIGPGTVRIRRTLQLAWPETASVEEEPAEVGAWLKAELDKVGITARDTALVLSREAFVTRRLDLPNAPDAELAELVRFQAATKATVPLDQLALDFVPLPVVDPAAGRPALMVTIDRKELENIQTVCTAAGLNLESVQGSPFTVAEVAVRAERQRGDDPNLSTLVVFQDQHRVEISILQSLGLLFSHHTRVEAQDERAIRGTMAEINRSVVVLGQSMHSTFEIARVCLIHAGEVDAALEQALSKRFEGRLHVIDPATDASLTIANSSDAVRLAGLAPALGAVLSPTQRIVPSVDFLNPRKPPPKRDERKRRMILGGSAAAAAAVVLGGLGWMYSSGLDQEIRGLQTRNAELADAVKQGKPTLTAHGAVQAWVSDAVDPLAEINRLNKLLPGADRLLLQTVIVGPAKTKEGVARLSGSGIARSDRDVNDLNQRLRESGYSVNPKVIEPYKLDPDYPVAFTFEIERLPSAPAPASAPKPAAATAKT